MLRVARVLPIVTGDKTIAHAIKIITARQWLAVTHGGQALMSRCHHEAAVLAERYLGAGHGERASNHGLLPRSLPFPAGDAARMGTDRHRARRHHDHVGTISAVTEQSLLCRQWLLYGDQNQQHQHTRHGEFQRISRRPA